MSDIAVEGLEALRALEAFEAAVRADERAKCIAEIEVERDRMWAMKVRSQESRDVIHHILRLLRSLSPLGLPTTEREQKK